MTMLGWGQCGRSANSNRKPAVFAAGNWEVDAAWPHIATLITTDDTEKYLLLAAIEAVAGIRPQEAAEILIDMADSDDEDIAEAAYEAMAMIGRGSMRMTTSISFE